MRAIFNQLHSKGLVTSIRKIFPFKQSHTVVSQHPVLTKNLLMLENRLQGAIRFLKNTKIHKNGSVIKLNQLPWYLLIGSKGVGKTSLLANAHIHYILEKQFSYDSLNALPPTENCDWWVTHDRVLIDVPGQYINEKKKNALSVHLWQNFLSLIKKYRGKEALSGIIVTISLAELIQPVEREQVFQRLSPRITELIESFGAELPCYFVISKCDLIPGFTEFFNDCSHEELNQGWGVTLTHHAYLEEFKQKFNGLIKRLNEQLIWRIHQEHNPYAKVFIKDFPLQLERVKEGLLDLLKLFHDNHDELNIKGIFLTSAIQDANSSPSYSDNHPAVLPAQELSQSFEILRAPQIKNQPYFIKYFLLHVLAKPAATSRFSVVARYPIASYAVSISIFLIALSISWQHWYHQSLTKAKTASIQAEMPLEKRFTTVDSQTIPITTSFMSYLYDLLH